MRCAGARGKATLSGLRSYLADSTGSNIATHVDRWSKKSEKLSGEGETDVLKNVTVTFGTINGGRLSNLVADRAEMTADIRIPVGVKVADLERELSTICDNINGVEMEISRRYEASWTNPGDKVVAAVSKNCADILNSEIAVTMRVGASDARLYRYAGVPSVVCGLTGHNLGAPDEHVSKAELEALGKIFALSAYDYLVEND